MRVISVIRDEMLQANNILLEMLIGEYLDIGTKILNNNQYQRKRVKRSTSIYSLLNQDMKKLCSIPTLVLAFTREGHDLEDVKEGDDLKEALRSEDLIILDGLQRTYTMRDVEKELAEPEKSCFLNHKIRVEIYSSLTKTGILYRMLTLNTGQTPMSKRHEIEILYSSYLDNCIEGIHFNKQVDSKKQDGIDAYNFDDAIEGFNSFLDSDEAAIDTFKILEAVQQIKKITDDNYKRDLFVEFIKLYNYFVHRLDEKNKPWKYRNNILNSVYGKDIPGVFNKAQTMSAFGAAVRSITNEHDMDLRKMKDIINGIEIGGNINDVMYSLLKVLEQVRESAKKIGVAQRSYLKQFFICLFDRNSASYQNINNSIELASERYDKLQCIK